MVSSHDETQLRGYLHVSHIDPLAILVSGGDREVGGKASEKRVRGEDQL